jgi:energy-coupling factor transporter ATP-binding protein EcfA2
MIGRFAEVAMTSNYERKTMKIKATDIGPVRSLDVQVSPGLNVLRGANGSGKSTVLKAVSYALTKSGEKPTPRDGSRAGRIECFGATVTFTSRATTKGNLEVESLSGRLDLGDLILNAYEDPAVSDKHRIRKLIELSGAQADQSQFEQLIGMTFPSGTVPTDLVDATDWAKRGLQEKAREKEDEFRSYAAKHNAALEAAQGVDVTVETDSERLTEAYVEAQSNWQSLVRERDMRTKQLTAAENARTQLEASKAAGIETVKEAESKHSFALEQYQAACVRRQQLEQSLAEAKADEAGFSRNATAAVKNAEHVKTHATAMASWEVQVAAAEALKPVDQADIDALQAMATAARQAIDAGALARKAKEQIAAAEDFRLAAELAAKTAEKLRANAAATDDVLAAELRRIGCPWYPVEVPSGNGTARRLKTKHPRRGETLVAELSEGERARDAIDVALSLGGKSDRPAVLILRQEQFEGLQPSVRAEIDQHAKERGVVILTAAASDDDEVTL